MSFLDNFMIAIMKEIHLSDDNKQRGDLIEVVVEIYQANMDEPMLGANVDMREVTRNDTEQISNEDFNFCCWYVIDKFNHNMNFAILIQNLMINMRTPFDLDPSEVSR